MRSGRGGSPRSSRAARSVARRGDDAGAPASNGTDAGSVARRLPLLLHDEPVQARELLDAPHVPGREAPVAEVAAHVREAQEDRLRETPVELPFLEAHARDLELLPEGRAQEPALEDDDVGALGED